MIKNRITKLAIKFARVLPVLAFVASIASLNNVCYTAYHQPKVPSALDSYRK